MQHVQLPAKLEPLRYPARYKVAYGGRGGTKSWGFARQLLIDGAQQKLRNLCTREVQLSIRDSVHKLLADQITELGLNYHYEVLQSEIRARNGSEFVFAGLSSQTIESIKSFEGIDRCWVEEAQKVRKRSWGILIPTIRKPGSEIWVSFNPDLDTDDTYERFILNPPPNTVLIPISYDDNPWLSDELRQEIDHLKANDPDEFENIWGGKCRPAVAGAIYFGEVVKLQADGRYRAVPVDPMLKVHTVWDLGWNDQTSIILCQRLGSEIRICEYIEDSHKTLAEYAAELGKRPYNWGTDFLPHDGTAKNLQTGLSAQDILRKLGRKTVHIVPNHPLEHGIKVARMMFGRCYIDRDKASRLMDCLKRYRRQVNTQTDEPQGPLHDEYSHGADSFRYLSLVVDKMTNETESPKLKYEQVCA